MNREVEDIERGMDDLARNIPMPDEDKITMAIAQLGILAIAAMDAAENPAEKREATECFRAVSTIKLAYTKRGHIIEDLERKNALLQEALEKEAVQ